MTNDELRALNRDRRIYQIAFVTRDLERSMRAWIDNLAVGPWKVFTFTNETVKGLQVHGKLVEEPFKFLIAISWIGDTEIEIIQPVHGPTIYEAFLREKGEGLHHIKERIPEDKMAETVSGYRQKGIGVTQTGQFFEDFHFYLDTPGNLDFIYELGNCPVQTLPPGLFSVYPPEPA